MDTWTKAEDELPEPEEDFGSFTHSRDVLVSAEDPRWGRDMHHAYLQRYEEDEFPATWKLVGRDSYDVPGTVTHWRDLPQHPNKD